MHPVVCSRLVTLPERSFVIFPNNTSRNQNAVNTSFYFHFYLFGSAVIQQMSFFDIRACRKRLSSVFVLSDSQIIMVTLSVISLYNSDAVLPPMKS